VLESVVATRQHQMRSERRECVVLGSSRLPCGRRGKSSFEESGRIAAGTATFLVRIKAHRGEPANEEAGILADKAISESEGRQKVVPWCQRTNRAVFTGRKTCRKAGKVTDQDRYSTFNNSVRDAIRRGAAENEVPKHEERLG